MEVDDEEAYIFLMDRFESGTCDYEHLLPWMKNSIKKA